MKTVTKSKRITMPISVTPVVHGYARCSTNESKQDINRQVRELKAAGCDHVWVEYEHGDSAIKEQQALMFKNANYGDTIITLEVSRLARSTKQLCEIVEIIKQKNLCLRILGSITLDCRSGQADPMTEAFLQIIAVFSELELQMIRQRVRSGIANARAKGKTLGRPRICSDNVPEFFLRYYPQYKSGKINVSELSRLTKISRPTCYRYLKALEG